MRNTQSVLFFLALVMIAASRAEDMYIRATTANKGRPNTFIGTTGDQIASSLLPSKTPAMLWGSVPAAVVTDVCYKISRTGRLQFSARVSDGWGRLESLTLRVVATGGCGAAQDSSGTEFVFNDNLERKSAIVCPENSGKIGCGVYMTGSDVNRIYNRRPLENEELLLNSSAGNVLFSCVEGARKGAITGIVTGVLKVDGCLPLGVLAPFCSAGVFGVSASIGALAGCVTSCFPGDARVQTSSGKTKMMSQLQIGDKVGILENGKLGLSEIYAFGHQDVHREVQFVNLETSDSKTLQLSPLHFVPTMLKDNQVLFKRAQDVLVGDVLFTVSSQSSNDSVLPHSVTRVSTITKQGLFNPLTIQGTIVVNGVAASVHSDWFMDPLFDAVGLTAHLPNAYQAILFPARLLYAVLGEEAYREIYEWLHETIDIAQFGTDNGGKIAAMGLVASGIGSMQLLKSHPFRQGVLSDLRPQSKHNLHSHMGS